MMGGLCGSFEWGEVRNAVGLTHYKIIKLLRIRSQSGLGVGPTGAAGTLTLGSESFQLNLTR